ncbi:MAG TPA: peptide ABC transporter substrate-binding protein [Kofleriaceae bacterium]|nr:peptide ABC transporter substrate-binding protein [Kofleriaceae bacterium]
MRRRLPRLAPWAAPHALVLALAFGAGGCGLPDGDYFGRIRDPDPDHLVWCNAGEPEYLDPAMAIGTTDINPIDAMFDGLADFDLEGFPEPSAATSWDVAPDQRRFVFHLRPDARWSDGRPLTARDFAYSFARLLHPFTASGNAAAAWRIKNGELYTANRVRRVMRDAAGFRRGDLVEIVGTDGQVAPDTSSLAAPDSNARAARVRLALRDLGAAAGDAYAWVPPGRQVTIVDVAAAPGSDGSADGGAARDWAYVFFDEDDGVYGWVPAAELSLQPNGAVRYTVRRIASEHVPGKTLPPDPEGAARPTAAVTGADLLMLPDVLGVSAPDDRTLVVETWAPTPYFVDLTVQHHFRAVPRAVASRWPRRWTLPEHIVTSGAYHMTEWRIRDRMELVRSATFWDRAHVRTGRITIFNLSDQTANTNLYIQGTCEALAENNVPAAYLPFLIDPHRPGGSRFRDFSLTAYLSTYFYIINVAKYPNVHFRRALNLAIDRSRIPDITRGGEQQTAQFTPGTAIRDLTAEDLALCGVARETPGVAMIVEPGALCYVPPPGLEYDPARAREEMAIARREMGARFPTRFTIKFNSGFDGHKLIAEWLQDVWQRTFGLEVEIEAQEFKTFLKDTGNGQYDVARSGWAGSFADPEAEFLPIFKCRSPENRPGFCSAEYDALMARAGAARGRKERLAFARQAEQILLDQAAIIPLYVETQRNLRKPYVRDLAVNVVGMAPFRRVWIDPDWRSHAARPEARAERETR